MNRSLILIFAGFALTAVMAAQTIGPNEKLPASPNDLPQTAGPNPHDISAYWEIRDIPGYRAARNNTGIVLTPEAQAATKQAAAERQRQMSDPSVRVIVPTASRYCEPMGMPFIMGQSPPISIIQAKNETLIFSEQHGSPRHIYTDGRPMLAADQMQLTTNGNSIGHWEGDTLVVETAGFNEEYGIRNLPGGAGGVNRNSHLVERFRLIDDGKILSYEATWTDPKLYAKPATVKYVYFREGPNAFSIDETCDAGDSLQGGSVIQPKQKY
jgi:hypothetical protein